MQACTSPFTSVPLSDGPHTLAVQAIDGGSNADPSPAARSFTVDTTAPDTAIGSHPKPKTKSRKATFTFSSTEAGSTFLCSYDGNTYAACSSPFTTPKLTKGKHRFDVIATDSLGNRDQSAAAFFWKVKKRKRHRR
jgi:large repetitive protein